MSVFVFWTSILFFGLGIILICFFGGLNGEN